MNLKNDFNNNRVAKKLSEIIKRNAGKQHFTFMDVCGTHTVNIFKFGIRSLLPPSINLISGPGCPVCVTAQKDIDYMIEAAKIPNAIVLTFGDMLKVPGSNSSLEKIRSEKKDIRFIYSPEEILEACKKNPKKPVIFFSVGFETTAPLTAVILMKAKKAKIKNLFIYASNKLVPPAMEAILNLGEIKIDGFVCPGHVSSIIGAKSYEPVVQKYNIPCVVAGFEPTDIIETVYMLLKQAIGIRKKSQKAKVEIQYTRCVDYEGNQTAREIMNEVFEPANVLWRGLGKIKKSGLKLNNSYKQFDILKHFAINIKTPIEKKGCRCAEVLRGAISPMDCKLFKKVCTPENPYGPCMVSIEGTCAAYYKYNAKS